jgi:hypothetical protein
MSTTQETVPVQGPELKVTTPTKGWKEWFTDKVSSVTSSVTGSSDTKASLEAKKAELKAEDKAITDKIVVIDEQIKNLPAEQVDPLQSAGRRRRRTKRSTRRSKRSKKTKRTKKSKRTRR